MGEQSRIQSWRVQSREQLGGIHRKPGRFLLPEKGKVGVSEDPHQPWRRLEWAKWRVSSPSLRNLRLLLVCAELQQQPSPAGADAEWSGDGLFLSVLGGEVHEPRSSDRGYTTFSGYRIG